jgi:hypothetical protein
MKKFLLLICVIQILSCNKKSDTDSTLLIDSVSTTKYYSGEILKYNNIRLYGKWKYIKMCGGLVGGCYPPTFDYLEIKSFGIYGLIKDNQVIQIGKINISIQNKDTFYINLIPDKTNDNGLGWSSKYVYFQGNDSLDLDEGCCDRFGFLFSRMK